MSRPLRRPNWSASLLLLGAVALAGCGATDTTEPGETADEAAQIGETSTREDADTPAEPDFTETVIEAPEDEGPGMHVHGLGEFSAAIDGETLVLSLRSPMYNLVGFERAAADEAEEAELAAAKATLRAPESLFELPEAAGCTLTEGTFTFVQAKAGKGEDHDHDHDEHDHGDDEHDHGEDEDGHSDDDHDHAEDEDAEAVEADADAEPGLGDLIADWSYVCTDIDELDSVSVVLFDEFERFETVSAIAIGDSTETADLTPSDNRLDMPD